MAVLPRPMAMSIGNVFREISLTQLVYRPKSGRLFITLWILSFQNYSE
nr:MAG TPA: hypothetical protein [Bacteriophage sp.]